MLSFRHCSLVGVQFVKNCSTLKIILKRTFEGMAKHLRVKYAENHSNGTQHWSATAKRFTRAVQEISIADFVVYGTFQMNKISIYAPRIAWSHIFSIHTTVFYRMRSAMVMSSWFTMEIQLERELYVTFVVVDFYKTVIFKSIFKRIIRMIHKNERKKKRIKVKCVQSVDFGWVVGIAWNCIANAIQWNRIDVRSVV